MKAKHLSNRMRESITQEAARIMAEEMLHDFRLAKQKACERLGYDGRSGLPGNDEIQAALQQYISLFKSDTQPGLLRELRQAALEAMEFLEPFQPRLVGAVLKGTADRFSTINLHVFADPAESALQFLIEKNIPHDIGSRRFIYRNGRQEDVTLCQFSAGGRQFELCLFPPVGLREPPSSTVDGKPIERATMQEVKALLQ
ncbi:MAG TPA: hypothetical protein VFX02_02670 [Gammaproteobacteria bacterium]|nr:hypothetical protein [Gammaproteobacteria bacterium]